MYSLNGRIVLITGASSGIGEACARAFAAQEARLILAARRAERLEKLQAELFMRYGAIVHTVTLDVRDQPAVAAAVAGLPAEWSEIEVLVNNAGLSRGLDKLHEGSLDDWEEMIDTNLKGLLYVTRAVLPAMVARRRGHVINIGSIAGHQVYPGGNVYCATKFAVNGLTQGLRVDTLGTGVRVSTVDPGMVETEFSVVRYHGDESRASKTYSGVTPLTGTDIAEAVVFCATRPPHVNINEIIIMPTDQATVTHVHRH